MSQTNTCGHVKVSNRWFETRLPAIIRALLQAKAEVPEAIVELDIIGPRHTAWGPYTVPVKGVNVHLERGQCLLSSRLLQSMYGWGRHHARGYLDRAVADGFLRRVRSEGNAGTVYQLVRYQEIQRENAVWFGGAPGGPPPGPPQNPHPAHLTQAVAQAPEDERPTSGPPSGPPSGPSTQTEKQTKLQTAPVPSGMARKSHDVLTLPLGDEPAAPSEPAGPTQEPHPRPDSSAALPAATRGPFEYPPEFEVLWSECWRRQGGNSKKGAYKAYRTTRRAGASAAELLAAVRAKRSQLADAGDEDTRHAPMLASFFGSDEPWREYAEMLLDEGSDQPPYVDKALRFMRQVAAGNAT